METEAAQQLAQFLEFLSILIHNNSALIFALLANIYIGTVLAMQNVLILSHNKLLITRFYANIPAQPPNIFLGTAPA